MTTNKPALPAPDKLDPNEQDAVTLWAEIWRLRTALQGPDGYATWQDAAIAERVRRVKAEAAVAAARAARSEQPLNLNDRAVQKRLAAQWGFVEQSAPIGLPPGCIYCGISKVDDVD